MDRCRRPDPVSEKPTPPISNLNIIPSSPANKKPEFFHPSVALDRNRSPRSKRNPATYLALDLKTPRLNAIHQHLWVAGLPTAARPLHRQKLIGRTILITEDPDEHLVWFEGQIFIKPLPDFLLDYHYWNDNLCSDIELYKSGSGFLLSYAWLVRHKSDLTIAKESGLMSKDIEWPNWIEFLEAFLDKINMETLSNVNQRYHYGELRLTRLNTLYRLLPPVYSIKNFMRGYRNGSTWHSAFFERNFKWMLAVFAVFSVFLSALQVGQATNKLQNNRAFQRVSYGFVITSLVALGASVALIFAVWLSLAWYHLLSTWRNNRAVNHRRRCSSNG